MKILSVYNILIGAALVLNMITGIFLHKASTPYKPLLVNFHKILILAAIIMLIFFAKKNFSNTPTYFSSLLIILSIIAIAALISGGIVSHKNLAEGALNITHRISSFLFIVGCFYCLFVISR